MSEPAPNSEGTARVIGRPFPPGVSGNPNGRPKDQFSFMGILRSALAEENKSGKSVGERIVRRYIKLALQGNQQAAEALMARIDGKPAQSLTLKGDSAEPLHVRHSARLEQEVKPKLPAPEGAVDMPDALRRTLASANRLQAPEQEQEAVEGKPELIDGKVVVGGEVVPDAYLVAHGLRDPDHQAPDVAE